MQPRCSTTACTRSSATHLFVVFDHLGFLRLEVTKFTMIVPVNIDTYTVTQRHRARCCLLQSSRARTDAALYVRGRQFSMHAPEASASARTGIWVYRYADCNRCRWSTSAAGSSCWRSRIPSVRMPRRTLLSSRPQRVCRVDLLRLARGVWHAHAAPRHRARRIRLQSSQACPDAARHVRGRPLEHFPGSACKSSRPLHSARTWTCLSAIAGF